VSTTQLWVRAPAETVFDVLMDPRCYPRWVVGAHAIRDVDADWPKEGSSFHHSVGVRPFRIHDSTTLERVQRPGLVELRARAWPLGEAHVRIEPVPRGDGTLVTMKEVPVEGPGALIRAPAEAITTLRNRVSLRRLRRLAEMRATRARV
jgi:uncharacterized protein YndB with AHSA1/START domain